MFDSRTRQYLGVPLVTAIRNKTAMLEATATPHRPSFPHKTLHSVTMTIYSIHTGPVRLDFNLAYQVRGGYIAIGVLAPSKTCHA